VRFAAQDIGGDSVMAGFWTKFLEFLGLEAIEPDDNDNQEEAIGDMKTIRKEENNNTPVDDGRFSKGKKPPTHGNVAAVPDDSKVRVLIYKPVSTEDSQSIIDNLKDKRPIIVNLDELDADVAQRILDFMSGAVYALSGTLRKAARNIFVVAPFNVDVSTAADEFEYNTEYNSLDSGYTGLNSEYNNFEGEDFR